MKVRLAILAAVGLALALLAFPRNTDFRIRAGVGRAVEEGLEQLGSTSFEERERALRRVVSLGEASRPALEEALSSPDAEVRIRVSAALRALDRAREDPGDRRLREYRRIIEIGLLRRGSLEPGTSRHDALLVDPSSAARAAVAAARGAEHDLLRHQRAVLLLRRLARPEGAGYLAELLERGWALPSTLHHVAIGLVRTGSPEVLPAVRAALSSEDPCSRRYAVRVLGRLGGFTDAERVRAATRDEEPAVRAESAPALVSLAAAEALPDLLRMTRDVAPSVRAAAVEAFRPIPGATTRRAAFAALSDLEPVVRSAGLRLLRHRGDASDAWAARALLSDPSAAVRGEAVRTLAALGLGPLAVAAGVVDSAPSVRRVAVLAARDLPPETMRRALAKMPDPAGSFLAGLRDRVLSGRGTN